MKKWRGYTDEEAYIFAETEGEPHNTITPIARKKGNMYELDLTLRNNITTEECPLGLYHPHNEYHHIKKEKYRADRGYGTCCSAIQIKGRDGTFKSVSDQRRRYCL